MTLTATLYETQKGMARQAYNYFLELINLGILTAGVLAALTTYLGYRNVQCDESKQPNNSYTGYETVRGFYRQFQRRSDHANACGVLTDAIVAANNGSLAIFATNTFINNDSTLQALAAGPFSTVA